jgi:hypothetical protein
LFHIGFQAHYPDSLLSENIETAQTEKQVHIYYFSNSICRHRLDSRRAVRLDSMGGYPVLSALFY